MIQNLEKGYQLRAQEVEKLNQSIEISSVLFNAARADYMEVLLTRRDALEAQMELIENKKRQMNAAVALYQALGGGWR
jgi:outer membrane protein TolC